MVSCEKCGLQDILGFNKNRDEVFLEFLTKFDQGQISKRDTAEKMYRDGLVRDKEEIREMIKKHNPDEITKSVLNSRQDFVSYFDTIKNPPPELGCMIEELGLDDKIIHVLRQNKIKQFYKFQEESIREITYGESIVIEAPTASGKTEAFLIPIIQYLKNKNTATANGVFALFIYPTKSLSRDQYPKILKFAKSVGIDVDVFDGDTTSQERSSILENPPHIIVTNFDVLHYHLLHQTKFSSLLHHVKFVVVDETHVYSGIFGSNVTLYN